MSVTRIVTVKIKIVAESEEAAERAAVDVASRMRELPLLDFFTARGSWLTRFWNIRAWVSFVRVDR